MVDLLKLLATPIVMILGSLMAGLALFVIPSRKSLKKAGLCLMAAGVSILYLFSIEPVSNLFVYSLESRYRPYQRGSQPDLDMMVILGGGFIPSGDLRKSAEASRSTYSRLFNGVEIFKQSGAKVLVLSGGTILRDCRDSDAEVMKDLAVKLGIPGSAIITEAGSRNTMEQADETARLFPPNGKRRIGIVTSAVHMLRAETTFRKRYPKDIIVSIAVNYMAHSPNCNLTIVSFVPSPENLLQTSNAIHELIGMVWYSL
ncbi:MAG: YdcF family protein [Candidatus Omnitrophota bacterium]|nr:YdcF family protein [Candidatus Omnitrophota bacterium]